MVWGPALTGSVAGQMLVMVGSTLLTVRLTVMVCDFAVTAAPDPTTVIFPV